MIKSSYTHNILRLYSTDKIRSAIISNISEGLSTDEGSGVYLITKQHTDVQPFFHPILINGHDDRLAVVVDVRPFTTVDRDGTIKIKNTTEYDFAITRAKLELIWNSDCRTNLISISDITSNIYSKWIAEALARNFSLDPENQMRCNIIAGFYAWCQYRDGQLDEYDDHAKAKAVAYVSKVTALTPINVKDHLEGIEFINDTVEFVDTLKSVLNNDPLEELNVRTFYTIVANNWRGAHANEVASLAVDYPPTLHAMVIAAGKDRTYRNTPIQMILDRNKRRMDPTNLERQVKAIYQDLD